MGLFSFVKNAGRKIFGDEEAEVKANQEAQQDAAVREKFLKTAREKRLRNEIEGLGLEVENLGISLRGDETVVLSGRVADNATREKVILAIGNVEGVGSVDDQLEVDQSEPEATFYTVQSGDSLSKIAQEHYGKASKYMVIFEANRPLLEDPDRIYPGQVLRIPPIED